jgi:hypothetical protein
MRDGQPISSEEARPAATVRVRIPVMVARCTPTRSASALGPIVLREARK